MTLMLGGFAIACATVLVFVHDPLPWDNEPPLELPAVYVMGVWLSILLSIAFIGLHAWQITEESRQLPMRSRRPNSCSRASSTCHNSTAWRPPPRTSWARRSPPSR